MAAGVRERMVRSAVVELARRGIQGASFAQVLAKAKAPRGSVYHHFPAGKQELVEAALDYMAVDGLGALDDLDGATVEQVIDRFVAMWRAVLTRSDFSVGCSVLGVTVTSDDVALRERAAGVFAAWHTRLAGLLSTAGMSHPDAAALATMMIASTEGAVVLARAQRTLSPLETVHAELITLARSRSVSGARSGRSSATRESRTARPRKR